MDTPIYDSNIDRPHIILGTAQSSSVETVEGDKREMHFKEMLYVLLKSDEEEIKNLMESINSKEPDSYENTITSFMGKIVLMGDTATISSTALRDMIPKGTQKWTDIERTYFKCYRKRNSFMSALVLMHQDIRNSFKEASALINADHGIIIKLSKAKLKNGAYYLSSSIPV